MNTEPSMLTGLNHCPKCFGGCPVLQWLRQGDSFRYDLTCSTCDAHYIGRLIPRDKLTGNSKRRAWYQIRDAWNGKAKAKK